MIAIIAHALVPIFFVIALGYVAGRSRSIDNHHVGELNALVMQYALPASLFVATATTPWDKMRSEEGLLLLLGLGMLIPYAGWYVYVVLRGGGKGDASVQALTVALPNYAAAGIPIVQAVMGSHGAVHVAVAIAAGSVLPSPLTLLVLELSQPAPADTPLATRLMRSIRRALLKPIVVAPIAGTFLSFVGLDLSPLISSSLQLIGVSAGGVALFLTGLVLSSQPFRLTGTVISGTMLANLVQPALVWVLTLVLPVPAEQARIAILLAALPSGFFGILFGISYKTESSDVGSIVIASTAFSIVTLGAAIAWLY